MSKTCRTDLGPYHSLYVRAGTLWSLEPGRMVLSALEYIPKKGTVVDLGCGDGKNSIFLERLGYDVIGIDLSPAAIQALRRRAEQSTWRLQGQYVIGDVLDLKLSPESADIVLAYGLYHCLGDDEVREAHRMVTSALKDGGFFIAAALTNDLPVPRPHAASRLYLRSRGYLFDLCRGWDILQSENGEINESHPPDGEIHRHSVEWLVARKATCKS